MSQPNSHWAELAKSLHEVADRFAILADNEIESAPSAVTVLIHQYGAYGADEIAKATARIDAIAKVLDVAAVTKTEGRGQNRSTKHGFRVQIGKVSVASNVHVPNPPTRAEKRASLQAENDALRAQLATLQAGGAA